MAKKKRQRPTATSTTTEDVDDDDEQRVGWSSIPGKRLEVDLKNKDDDEQLPSKGGKKKRPHPTTSKPTNDSPQYGINDEDEFNNLEKWTSHHYDNDSLEDDTDLYNLDDKFDVSNKYDGSMIDGSNDAGMFLR